MLRRRSRFDPLALVPAAFLCTCLVAACGPQAEDIGAGGPATDGATHEPLGEPRTPSPPPVDPATDAGPAQAGTVHVTLRDLEIDMPRALPTGSTTFQIHNSSDREHSFEIEGEGIERALPAPLQPGDGTQLSVDLGAGTYRVYCPVEDHAERGMEIEVTVEEREGEGPPAP